MIDFGWQSMVPLITLTHHWQEYTDAMTSRPYDPDHVQAMGLRYASAWKKCLPVLSQLMDVPVDEIDYSMKRNFMARLEAA